MFSASPYSTPACFSLFMSIEIVFHVFHEGRDDRGKELDSVAASAAEGAGAGWD